MPRPSHHSSLYPMDRSPPLPMFPRHPTTPLSLLTMSWKTLNQEQLALETWTCKDPLCRVPHHQFPYRRESPTDSHSTPSTVRSHTLRPCPQPSSEDGYVAIHSPRPCMAASPLLVE